MDMLEISQQHDVAPPAYTEKPGLTPLAIRPEYLCDRPLRLTMKSSHGSPDFAVSIANADDDGEPLFVVEIESIKLREYHEMQISDARTGARVFTVKRATVEDGLWRYSASSPGMNGRKLLEFDSRADLLGDASSSTGSTSPSSSRLIFRNCHTGELDALELRVAASSKRHEAEVLYQDQLVGSICIENAYSPLFDVRIHVPGIDPLLLVVMTLCMDDRMMSDRRRTRRGFRESAKRIVRHDGTAVAAYYAVLLTI